MKTTDEINPSGEMTFALFNYFIYIENYWAVPSLNYVFTKCWKEEIKPFNLKISKLVLKTNKTHGVLSKPKLTFLRIIFPHAILTSVRWAEDSRGQIWLAHTTHGHPPPPPPRVGEGITKFFLVSTICFCAHMSV